LTLCRELCKTGEPIEMPFGAWTGVGQRKHVSLYYMGVILASHNEYDWTVCGRRRCGLMSNYILEF